MNPTLQDLQGDLKAAGQELLKYEKKFSVPSKSFHDCFMAGLIDDCGNADYQIWAGCYEIKQDLERRCAQMTSVES